MGKEKSIIQQGLGILADNKNKMVETGKQREESCLTWQTDPGKPNATPAVETREQPSLHC